MDKLEGWGEKQDQDNDNVLDENLPEGWQQGEDKTTISEDTLPEGWQHKHDQIKLKSNGFKSKKKGKLKSSEVIELKRTCKSLDGWLKTKTISAPPSTSPTLVSTPPTMNDAQEETDDMDWEEMVRQEKLDRVGRRKKEWENTRISRSLLLDVLEEAMIFVKTKNMRELMDEIVQEGWKRMETRRVLAIINDCEAGIKARVEAEVFRQMEEEKLLLDAMKSEEEKQMRLERIKLLQVILKKKMTASKLRDMIRMMHLMTIEDLEMEVDMVVEQAKDMMETEAGYHDCDHDIAGDDTMDQGDGDDLHGHVEAGVQGVPQVAADTTMLVDNPEDVWPDDHGGGGTGSGGVEDESVGPSNPKIQIFSNIPIIELDGGLKKLGNTLVTAHTIHTPSTRRALGGDDSFGLQDLKTMVARWEQQEKGETTPTMETVSTRVRRRSEKIENIVTKMSLESTDCSGDCKYTSGTFLSNFGI